MSVKFSQLPLQTTVNGTYIVPVVGGSGPTSYKTTLADLSTYILSGNAATATKLATARTINGVAFDGTANITLTATIPTATTSVKGAVIVGSGITVAVDGTISTVPAAAKMFHGFSVDATGNLIYSTTSDSTISLQDQYGVDLYEDTDIGTEDYAYSMDVNGNLIVTFS
jgi:hypothetical protein